MSNLYIYEPATNGKVVIDTTMGEIEIELWPKEAPKACRNFIALIMEGYYDGCIFHRIVENFIIQTGDPTGTGHGGESFYGEPFEDEPHQRLRYSRRGLVGMANNNERNTNTSQFFITLDRTDELQSKHTIFGKVAADGNTIFNVVKIGQLQVDDNDRPLYPPKIKGIRILDNPFDDIIPRITAVERKRQEIRRREIAKERHEMAERKKIKKNNKLLSFGDEAEVEEKEVEQSKKKTLSRPDLGAAETLDIPSFEDVAVPPVSSSFKTKEKDVPVKKSRTLEPELSDLSSIRATRAEEEAAPADKRQVEIEALEASLRKSKRRSPSPDSHSKKPKVSLLQETLASYSRGRGGSKGKGKGREEDDILATLTSFRGRMRAAPKEEESLEVTERGGQSGGSGDVGLGGDGDDMDGREKGEKEYDYGTEGLDVDNDFGWLNHKLVELRDVKQEDQNRRAETDYEVIDTKARGYQAMEEARGSRGGRGGRGRGSGGDRGGGRGSMQWGQRGRGRDW